PLLEELCRPVEPCEAREPDQLATERRRQHLCELRLPDARRPLDQDGLLERRGEVEDRPHRPRPDVLERLQAGDDVVDGSEHGRRGPRTLTHALPQSNPFGTRPYAMPRPPSTW